MVALLARNIELCFGAVGFCVLLVQKREKNRGYLAKEMNLMKHSSARQVSVVYIVNQVSF